jgi:hypothetical protein
VEHFLSLLTSLTSCTLTLSRLLSLSLLE